MNSFSRSGAEIISNNSGTSRGRVTNQRKPLSQKNFIDEANKIMRERMKNKGSTINSKSRLKSVILNDTKEISLKNYLIDLLKTKRTDINEKERNITKALKESERTLDTDTTKFASYVEGQKKLQKQREEAFTKVKNSHIENERRYQELEKEIKQLQEDLDKTIRSIYRYKTFAEFICNVFKEDFPFKFLKEEKELREETIDRAVKSILDCAPQFNKAQTKFLKVDGNEKEKEKECERLLSKFRELEEKIIKQLDDKQKEDNDGEYQREMNIAIEADLVRRLDECKNDVKKFKKEQEHIEATIQKLQTQKLSEVEQSLRLIEDLKNEVCETKDKVQKNKMPNVSEGINQSNITEEKLREFENKINNYIEQLKYIERTDNAKFIKITNTRKEINKIDKQNQQKQLLEEANNARRQRALKRAEKVVIKGRKVPQDYPVNKGKKKNKKDEIKNENHDMELLLYFDDDI